MHPDKPEAVDELYAYFRQILVNNLSPAQLALHDYYSMQDPLLQPEDDDEEFPFFEGIPELLAYDDE
jgi:hypothetical protein